MTAGPCPGAPPASGRSRLFETASVELHDRYAVLAGLHFVETGTTRGETQVSMEGDGWGTRWWGWLAQRHGCTLETIDIDAQAIEKARGITIDYASVITYTCADSVAALSARDAPIHLLYLDSLDSGPGSPEHHLAEARAALPRLAPEAVVVLDDTSETDESPRRWAGKGTLAVPFLIEQGFALVAAVNGGVVLARGRTMRMPKANVRVLTHDNARKDHVRHLGLLAPWVDFRREPEVAAALAPGAVVLDIGAGIGDVTRAFLEAGCRVFAWEPRADAFECLKENCPGATVFQAPVGNGERWNDESVDTLRIDDVPFDRVDIVKVKVAGRETSVLDGMRETLAAHKPVLIVGMGARDMVEGLATIQQVEERLPAGHRMRRISDRDWVCAPGVTSLVGLHVDEYRTGWGREIRGEPQAVWIDAHAPSAIYLTPLNDGPVVITGDVQDGGNTRGQLFIDGEPVAYGEVRTVLARAGHPLRLTVAVDDGRKDQCWNYWRVVGAEIRQHVSEIPHVAVRPFPAEIRFRTHTRLGDGIGVLTAIDSYCAANGIPSVVVEGGPTFVDIAAVFEFRHVVVGPAGEHAFDADELFAQASWHEPWAKRIVRRLRAHFGGDDAEIVWPRVRIHDVEKEDVVLGQFDTRSAAPLKAREMRAVVDAVAGPGKFALVGGVDTQPYLDGCEYRLGDLAFIVRQLLACQYFVGVDSGVAHLAGTLGVRSYVVNAIDLDVVQKMFGAYPNMTILDRADYDGLPKVVSRPLSAIAPRPEIWVVGMPSRGGGADTELDHQIDLWRMHGVEVHIVPLSDLGGYLPSPASAAMKSCLDRGCRVHRYAPDIFAGKVVISFCNGPFLKALPEIVESGRPDCVIWVNCMTWVFEDEKRAHANGWIDLHAYQSKYQRDLIVPQLERIGPVHELPYRAFYNVQNAQQAVRFNDRPPTGYFGIGRISRNDPAKFAPDTWRIYDDVESPLPKRALILGYDSRIEERIGPPPAGMDCVTYPVGEYPVEALLSEIHVMIHKTGGSRENWPRTLLEAYNAGVVPIFENDYGCREMIIDGVTGFLCDTSDEMSARASQLAHDEPLRKQMAEAGYRHLTETLAAAAECWDGWRPLLETKKQPGAPPEDRAAAAPGQPVAVTPVTRPDGIRWVIDCITATRSTQTTDGRESQRIEFSVWLNLSGLPRPVTARVLPVEVLADQCRPLTAPILVGPFDGDGSHHHYGEIADVAPGRHHRLTVRVHDGNQREYIGSLEIVHDNFEEIVTGLGDRRQVTHSQR